MDDGDFDKVRHIAMHSVVVARSEEKPLKAQVEQCEMVNKFTLTEQFRFSLILFIVNPNSNSNLHSIWKVKAISIHYELLQLCIVYHGFPYLNGFSISVS